MSATGPTQGSHTHWPPTLARILDSRGLILTKIQPRTMRLVPFSVGTDTLTCAITHGTSCGPGPNYYYQHFHHRAKSILLDHLTIRCEYHKPHVMVARNSSRRSTLDSPTHTIGIHALATTVRCIMLSTAVKLITLVNALWETAPRAMDLAKNTL